MLDQFLLLSLLLHVFAMVLLGDTSGAVAKSGERLWGTKVFNFDATLSADRRESVNGLRRGQEQDVSLRTSVRSSTHSSPPTASDTPGLLAPSSLTAADVVSAPAIEQDTAPTVNTTAPAATTAAAKADIAPTQAASPVSLPVVPPSTDTEVPLPAPIQAGAAPTAETLRFIAKEVTQATTAFVVSTPTVVPPVATLPSAVAVPVPILIPAFAPAPAPAPAPREPSVSPASSATLNAPSVAALPTAAQLLPMPISLAVPPTAPVPVPASVPAPVVATIPPPIPLLMPAPVQILKAEQAIIPPALIALPMPKLDTRSIEVPMVSPPLPAIKSILVSIPVPIVPAALAPVTIRPAPRQGQLIVPTPEAKVVTPADIKPADLLTTKVESGVRPIDPLGGTLANMPPAKTNVERNIDSDIFGPKRDGMLVPPVLGAGALTAAPSDSATITPKLDLDGIRNRARAITSEGSGRRTLLPFPLAPPVVIKKNIEQIFDKALKRPDCRDTYAALGLAAVIPLVRDAVTENGCKW